jgi:cytochrome c biogenesis protein CcmG, thiol:disulfide interchange protein DsbE
MRLKRATRACAVTLALMCAWAASAQGPLEHKPAPDFIRTDFDGRRVTLSELHGKVVLLNFWATWCAPCQAELPHFAEWQRRYRAQGLQVIAVSMDDEPKAPRALASKLKLGFPVLLGDEKLGELYGGVLGFPVSFLIARDGTMTARIEGEADLQALEARIQELLAQK